jgi:hypothetical protein
VTEDGGVNFAHVTKLQVNVEMQDDALTNEQSDNYKELVDMGKEVFTAPHVVEGYEVSIRL